jgi:ribosomal protein S18 acetylase RimI-like enzyme
VTALPVVEGRLAFRATTEADLPFVLQAERATDFVRHWPAEEHRAVLTDPHAAHWTIEADAAPAGFLILRGLGTEDRSLELKRLVIARPGRGLGRLTLRLLKRVAFERLAAHRLWLDVMPHNDPARHLYASEGFKVEGTMREAIRVGGRFRDLVLMSVLEHEHRPA